MSQLVSPTQTSFFSGSKIVDNMAITLEVVHSMKLKKEKQGWIAIKVDLDINL